MKLPVVNLYFDLDTANQADSVVISKAIDAETVHTFKEGDTYTARVHLRKNYSDNVSDYHQLGSEHELILVVSVAENAVDDIPYLCYQNTFEEVFDEDGDICYEALLDFATQESLDFLADVDTRTARIELVVRDKNLGYQKSYQGDITLIASLLKGAVRDIGAASINVGSYQSVVSIANGIVDQRILDLRAGAPVEFDTLYELAEYAQKVRSHEIVVGDFQSYLDGKTLADQNLTVTALNQLAVDTSTYDVSHEPWMPREVLASIVE